MIILGLNSGTSRDGVAAAIFRSPKLSPGMKIEILGSSQFPYPAGILNELTGLENQPDLERLSRLNFLLGEFFAQCAIQALKKSGVRAGRVALIGSHGQTVGHFPARKKMSGYGIRATLQLGEPSVIAARTGITTVGDFRPADIAAGGEGAPVLTVAEYLLFHSAVKNRMALNLGGIANFSLIPKRGKPGDVRASDCGPCNILLDGLARALSKGRMQFDRGGQMAMSGRARREWVRLFLKHPFFKRRAPKSSGREDFSRDWLNGILRGLRVKSRADRADLIRSGARAVAQMVSRCYFDNYAGFPLEEVIVSGGGVENRALVLELSGSLGIRMIPSDELGVPAQAKEPVGFGLLAELCVYGKEGNLPGATGAGRGAILGKIAPGRNWRKVVQNLKAVKGVGR